MRIKKKYVKGGFIVLVLILLGVFGIPKAFPNELKELALCLDEKGTTFYGAFWCPHCAEQKEKFGKYEKDLPYVECSLPDRSGSTLICIEEGIDSYPTWEFGDGSRKTGALEPGELAARAGCEWEG